MIEIWKDIKGFEGLYQVSNLGRVKSVDRFRKVNGGTRLQKGCLLKNSPTSNGYLKVCLRDVRRVSHSSIHRLVAKSFIKKTDVKKNTVNHIDGNKHNNIHSNLEWVTQVENINHSIKCGLRKQNRGDNGNARMVINKKTGIVYKCILDAVSDSGFSYSNLRKKLNNRIKNNTSLTFINN